MVTGFDIIGTNKALQEHWIKRLVAIIIDGIIIWIPLFIIHNIIFWSTFAGWGALWGWGWWFFDGLIIFLYFVILEMTMKATIGKRIMSLQVVTTTGQPVNAGGVIIRNVTKVIFPLVLLDMLVGLLTQGDPRQKMTDRAANMTVTRTDQGAYAEEQFRQMQDVPPHPQVQPGAWGQPGQPYPPQQSPAQQGSPPPGGWSGQPGTAWTPGQQAPGATWPQHAWNEQGQLLQPARFCSSCGGQLAPRGDGKMVCVRCGLVY